MDRNVLSLMLRKLYSSEVHIAFNDKDVQLDERFWVISGKNGPRWIVPQNSYYGHPILKDWYPYDLSSKLKWLIIRTAYRVGILGLLPGVNGLGVAGSLTHTWKHLGYSETQKLIPVIYIGTPGLTQKAVVSMVEMSNKKKCGVVKVPIGIDASKNILHEFEVLKKLSIEKPNLAPEPLYINLNRGISVQSVVQGKLSAKKLSPSHLVWLKQLNVVGALTTVKDEAEKLISDVNEVDCIKYETKCLIKDVLKAIKNTEKIPVVVVHGDFTPWNIIINKKHIYPVDWEDTRLNYLPLYDLLHFYWIKIYLFNGSNVSILSSKFILECDPYLKYFNLTKELISSIEKMYLCDQIARRSNNKFDDQYALYLIKYLKKILYYNFI